MSLGLSGVLRFFQRNSPLNFVKKILRFLPWVGTCFCLFVFSASADDKDALAAIKKLGGAVRGVAQDTEALEIDFHLQGDDLTDAGLVHLSGLQNVVSLHLAGTQVTDAGLTQLKGLSSLRRLHLEKTGAWLAKSANANADVRDGKPARQWNDDREGGRYTGQASADL